MYSAPGCLLRGGVLRLGWVGVDQLYMDEISDCPLRTRYFFSLTKHGQRLLVARFV